MKRTVALSGLAFLLFVFSPSRIDADLCSCDFTFNQPLNPQAPIVCSDPADCDACEPVGTVTQLHGKDWTYWECECDDEGQSNCCRGRLEILPPSPNTPVYIVHLSCLYICGDWNFCEEKQGGSAKWCGCHH